ncbi:hypothetical protein [Candidatus Poriferisodalis sp.]|uniref:hypothetical protein n=1 Tax=Candidatus Poriferisodalis sp. TaxID=3101277 RepID=UPI003B5AD9FC
MTAEDRLRSQLRDAGASMPVGSGSLAGVQARAAQLQRRRNAVRGGAGAFALVAVAAVGLVSLRDGGIEDFAASVETESLSELEGMPAATQASSAESVDLDEMTEDEVFETAPSESMSADESFEEQIEVAAASEDSVEDPPAVSDGAEMSEGAVFATAVSAVSPPAQAEGVAMRYSFSGAHAVAQAADDWYAYDGSQWQSVGLPENIEVVAVDLSGSERIAILGVVRPLECAIEYVIGVQTADGWSFARIDDDTPPMVNSEMLGARIRVTDSAVEVERTELLTLFDECADPEEYADPFGDAAKLVADLEQLGEIQRQSWLVAELEPDFAQHWPRVASDDAPAAALQGSELRWTATEAPLYTVEARELTAARTITDDAIAVALHETTMLEVATSVEVSDGMAVLRHGDQSWDVCPIPDPDEAHGEIGWAGEHLAVVVGKPEQTLFVVKRAG